MTEKTDESPAGSRLPAILAAAAAVAAVNAAAWFYMKKRQPGTDETTRARLAPRGRP